MAQASRGKRPDLPDPDELTLNDPANFDLWWLMHTLDWRWPPDVVKRQDQAELEDLIAIEDWFSRIRGSIEDQAHGRW